MQISDLQSKDKIKAMRNSRLSLCSLWGSHLLSLCFPCVSVSNDNIGVIAPFQCVIDETLMSSPGYMMRRKKKPCLFSPGSFLLSQMETITWSCVGPNKYLL